MKHTLGRHRHVANLRQLQPHQRQENPLDRVAHEVVLHGRRPNDRRRVDRSLALGHAGHVEHRVLVGERVEPGVVPERTFGPQLAQFHIALEHDLGLGRNFEIAGSALHHLDRATPQEPRHQHLVEIGRQRKNGREHGRRIRADRHRHVHALTHSLGREPPVMLRALLVRLPVHAGGPVVVYLHPVHAAVPLARVGVLRKDKRQRDEPPAVLRPALQDRVFRQ